MGRLVGADEPGSWHAGRASENIRFELREPRGTRPGYHAITMTSGQERGADSDFESAMIDAYAVALQAARTGLAEGGIPIGSALFAGDRLLATGWNQRVQKSSAILHAEMDCLQNAGRPRASWGDRLVLYTTLSPCMMCAAASLIYGVTDVVIGDNKTFVAGEELLSRSGVTLHVINDEETIKMFSKWTLANPELWSEDIGRRRG